MFCSKGVVGEVVLLGWDVVGAYFEENLEVLKCNRFLILIVVR